MAISTDCFPRLGRDRNDTPIGENLIVTFGISVPGSFITTMFPLDVSPLRATYTEFETARSIEVSSPDRGLGHAFSRRSALR